MRYQDGYLGSKEEFSAFIKKAVPDLFAGKLVVEGAVVQLPEDADLDYRVKYDDNLEGASISIKISWEKDSGDEQTD